MPQNLSNDKSADTGKSTEDLSKSTDKSADTRKSTESTDHKSEKSSKKTCVGMLVMHLTFKKLLCWSSI